MGARKRLSQKEQDVRECTLAACHRVGLYTHISDHNSPMFLERATMELVSACDEECPIGPPYNDCLMTFKQKLRHCLLNEKGYRRVYIFLQRLCEDQDWHYFCRYHRSWVWRR
jgi:hypothetical protein